MSERLPPERRADLLELYRQLSPDWVCPLKGSRTNVVFGSGNADAELVFVGEAPGASEDREGKPFVGNAGRGKLGWLGLVSTLGRGTSAKPRRRVSSGRGAEIVASSTRAAVTQRSWRSSISKLPRTRRPTGAS